jgi:hypothetical protein
MFRELGYKIVAESKEFCLGLVRKGDREIVKLFLKLVRHRHELRSQTRKSIAISEILESMNLESINSASPELRASVTFPIPSLLLYFFQGSRPK